MNAENTAQRLQETAAKCLSSLDAWNKDIKNEEARESLLEAVHELRKVTSRLEIDIALNDRKVVNAKPLPIPEHKSKIEKKTHKPLADILPVAEIKESREKRKIKIETDDDTETQDDAPSADSQEGETEKKARRPRRKKQNTDD